MKPFISPSFRWMQPADIATIGTLGTRIWNAHYPGIVSQAQIDYMLPRRYSAEALAAQLEAGEQFLLLEIEGETLGFVSVGALSNIENPILRGDNFGSGTYFLHKFYLAPECQGKGLGKALLRALWQQMPEIRLLRLQVHRRNETAWRFYLAQGFRIVQEADFAIGGGFEMNDFVMQWEAG